MVYGQIREDVSSRYAQIRFFVGESDGERAFCFPVRIATCEEDVKAGKTEVGVVQTTRFQKLCTVDKSTSEQALHHQEPEATRFLTEYPPYPSFTHDVIPISYVKAIVFLISAIAFPGFSPLGQVLEQLRIVWHRYKLILLSSIAFLSALCSSRLSASQRYDCMRTAGPRYSSLFHQ